MFGGKGKGHFQGNNHHASCGYSIDIGRNGPSYEGRMKFEKIVSLVELGSEEDHDFLIRESDRVEVRFDGSKGDQMREVAMLPRSTDKVSAGSRAGVGSGRGAVAWMVIFSRAISLERQCVTSRGDECLIKSPRLYRSFVHDILSFTALPRTTKISTDVCSVLQESFDYPVPLIGLAHLIMARNEFTWSS